MSVTISFRTEEQLRDDLDRVAGSLDRNRNWLINQALSRYLELHEWQVEQIRKGMADSDAGRTYSTAELKARLAKKIHK